MSKYELMPFCADLRDGGKTEVFKTEKEAINAAMYLWEHLTEREQARSIEMGGDIIAGLSMFDEDGNEPEDSSGYDVILWRASLEAESQDSIKELSIKYGETVFDLSRFVFVDCWTRSTDEPTVKAIIPLEPAEDKGQGMFQVYKLTWNKDEDPETDEPSSAEKTQEYFSVISKKFH